MKSFLYIAVSSMLLAAVPTFSQHVLIGYPPAGATVEAGSELTVQIVRPEFLSSATEVAVVVAMNSCPSGSCLPPIDIMGPVLYNGPFNPQYGVSAYWPYQNFTVTVPDYIGTGLSQLNVFHVNLIGASNEPWTELLNITLNLQE